MRFSGTAYSHGKRLMAVLDLPVLPNGRWILTRDGDPSMRKVFDRHYSRHRYADGRKPKLFIGPGEKLALATSGYTAIFAWRLFDSMGPWKRPHDVNCAILRNERPDLHRSSDLIKEAEVIALRRWPNLKRFYTFVNGGKILSANPGYCFQCAGWEKVGLTKGGLHILEKAIS